jgi:nitrogen fixation/metabolism regulation signal transduction histidine kinase
VQRGEVDGIVVSTPEGEQLFTLSGVEKTYRLLIEEMKEGAVMLSDNNTVLYCNSGFADIIKQPLGKIIGTNIQNVISPINNSDFGELLASGRKGEGSKAGDVSLRVADKIVRTYMAVNTFQKDDVKTTFLVITDLTQHLQELSAERERLFNVLDSLPAMVALLTPDHHVAFANRGFKDRFGESQGRYCYDYCFGNTEPCSFCESYKVLETGKPHRWEVKCPDGSFIDAYDFPFTDTDGNRLILEMDIDITERKSMEQQLKDAERLAAIGATAGMVGHDIRNPLQSIMGDIFLAKSDVSALPENEEKKSLSENLESILDSVEYINKIVQDLQDFAKPITLVAQETDLQDLCEAALFKNGLPDNIEGACEVEENVRRQITDPALLTRVLGNLISNSVQAMPEGGKLYLHVFKEGNDTLIRVEDTGGGIPESIGPKLFTPLFTTKSKGQGFGLAVVKRVIEALGGTVTYKSEVGHGTKFILRLPPKRNKR